MPTIRLLLEYDGGGFSGWQVQPDRRTVQGEIEGIIARLTGRAARVAGAGRTDAGVHALGQVAAVSVPEGWDAERLGRSLRALLPEDIVLREAAEADAGFDPRRDARAREYQYRIGRHPTALERRRRWTVPEALDGAAIRAAARTLLGEHDFAAFSVESAARPFTRVRMEAVEVEEDPDRGELRVTYRASHFLMKMVRMMTAALVEIGRGRLGPEAPARMLAGGPRPAFAPAPAHGLYLVRVIYPQGGLTA